MTHGHAFLVDHEGSPRAILREVEDYGFRCFDLVGLPRRLLEDGQDPALLLSNVDARRVKAAPTPASLLMTAPSSEVLANRVYASRCPNSPRASCWGRIRNVGSTCTKLRP